ncbi:MAG: ammonium transporter [Pseudanabaenaceae cyanobacterium SKYGB_i_bin29]|nr:ammonium transporter [Pseudanabaenaceae cyanobacterium SKYG29]MDW8420488.1 ammonium transporter [Pseudanabaenaceae cyanobacterium SKYGB_i_bin29]
MRKKRFWLKSFFAFLCILCLSGGGIYVLAGDPSGTATGKAVDVQNAQGETIIAPEGSLEFFRQKQQEPLAVQLADAVGQNRIAINLMWVLISGFLVMLMQAGFALVETGFTQAKNAAHTMLMNFLIYVIGMTGFWIAGFALMYGGTSVPTLGGTTPLGTAHEFTINILGKSFGLFATKGWFLGGDTYDIGVYAIFLFQMVFMDTAATIPTGAMAERWSLKSFAIYGLFMSMFLYPLFGNWAWGGGWLASLGTNFGLGHGYVDFAGSGVVHAIGGMCALAGAQRLGPRLGKYNPDGSINALPGHNIPMGILGAFILAFGWFGFNAGSTLGAAGGGLLRIGVIATVTMLASAGGALSAAIYMICRTGKPDPTMIANGLLAGLVAVTAASGFIGATAGFVIGVIAGVVVCYSVETIDRLGIDDPVGAISVHGVCGILGVLCVGIFADGTAIYGGSWNGVEGAVRGLLYGDVGQFIAQLIGAIVLIIWGYAVSAGFFTLLDEFVGMRVPAAVEVEGLDIAETGVIAYSNLQTNQ